MLLLNPLFSCTILLFSATRMGSNLITLITLFLDYTFTGKTRIISPHSLPPKHYNGSTMNRAPVDDESEREKNSYLIQFSFNIRGKKKSVLCVFYVISCSPCVLLRCLHFASHSLLSFYI